jgi:taurine transport system substrate-binding protein
MLLAPTKTNDSEATTSLKKIFFIETAVVAISSSSAYALDEITVACFLEWPTPNQFAQNSGAYEEAMGVKINWVAFDAGTAMSAAMASGDVHISFSQGIPPFVVATSAGQDLQVVDVAVSYSENDNCVVRSDLEIDKSNAAELAGKEVGVPIGTAAHYGFLKQMAHFDVDTSTMKIVNMAPADGAAAFANGNLDMVCG